MEGFGTEATTNKGKVAKMSEERRQNEIARREEAQAHAGEIVSGSGKRGKPRRMAQMVSVRLDGELLGKLKAVAEQRDLSLSDLLREGAELVAQYPRPTETRIHIAIHGARLQEIASTPDELMLTGIYN
jgi:uncharacterized protein (DUF4415 family)